MPAVDIAPWGIYIDTRGGYVPASFDTLRRQPATRFPRENRIMNRTTLKIEGMTCGHCVMSVKKALTTLDGVTVQDVRIGSATVEYDPAMTSPASIAEAVTEAGYSSAPQK